MSEWVSARTGECARNGKQGGGQRVTIHGPLASVAVGSVIVQCQFVCLGAKFSELMSGAERCAWQGGLFSARRCCFYARRYCFTCWVTPFPNVTLPIFFTARWDESRLNHEVESVISAFGLLLAVISALGLLLAGVLRRVPAVHPPEQQLLVRDDLLPSA